ncbi:short-chain dehydrogenase/reductase [Aspergillus luchuensis]|uniref:Short-chain dehydrogenase/reductase n=1 Tax=Aspergillus kawachii TaxID=1069201 RepID=A0A146FYE7_ASPKA|nr:short-chain dehydrogenase/reductase [Aspergillus luchuensis]
MPKFRDLSEKPLYPALGRDDDDKRVDGWTRLYQVREAARVSWKSAMAAWIAGAKRSEISRQRSLRRPLSGERRSSFDERLTSTKGMS